MVRALLRSILPTFLVTVLVTLLNSLSWAAGPSCAWVYGGRSVYTTSYGPLKNLVYENYALMEAFKALAEKGLVEETRMDSQAAVKKVEKLAEEYLSASGIEFQKIRTKYRGQNKSDQSVSLQYHRYILKGTASGDEFSRMIYDVQRRELSEQSPGRFMLDLFYELKYPDSGAHYRPAEHLIEIGPRSLERFVTGLATEIQHEIIHHFEERKVEAGKMSLARVEFESGKEVKGDPYSIEFAFDELITNLQDLKNISDQVRNRAIDDQLILQMVPEKLKIVRDARQKLQQDKKELVEVLFGRVQAQFGLLKKAIQARRYKTNDFGGIEVNLSDGSYQQATIHLEGLVGSSRETQIQLLRVIGWTEKEIWLLRQEFSTIIK